MNKLIDFIGDIMAYSAKHWSAIFITDLVMSIGLLNPFVVEKFQTIYKYPVSKTGSIVWDVVFMLMIVFVWNLDKLIKRLETDE